MGERFDRFEEQLAIITGLWETPVGERFTHEGRHYTLVGSPALPKPAQTPLPMVIGGTGKRRTPELAGRYASDFNLPFVSVRESAGLFENVRVVAGAAGRGLSTLTLSNALAVCAGQDETEARRRATAIGRDLDRLRRDGSTPFTSTVGEPWKPISSASFGVDTRTRSMATSPLPTAPRASRSRASASSQFRHPSKYSNSTFISQSWRFVAPGLICGSP